jgi:hypothetical protein
MFATSKTSRKYQYPTYEYWINVLKIFKYINYSKFYGIKITNNINIEIYVDEDLGRDEETKRSTTGFVIMIESTPKTWFSKLQISVALKKKKKKKRKSSIPLDIKSLSFYY